MIDTKSVLLAVAMGMVGMLGCATDPGDEVECPTCDGVTQLLVGAKCVAIEEVAACGPDGHAHGDECHCFSGQEPTTIDGVDYCLQQGCASGDEGEGEGDVDALACGELDETAEAVTAVATFDDFSQAHVELETPALVTIPAGGTGFVHFPGMETAEYAVYVDTTGAIQGFTDGSGTALTAHAMGANPDCEGDLPELWHVEVVNDTDTAAPQVIELSGPEGSQIFLFVHPVGEDHDHEE